MSDASDLIAAATALIMARGDGTTHTVTAAVLTADGSISTAINLFHFTGGPCAELTALAVAAAQTSEPVTLVVAVGDRGRGVIAPCGRCRQVLLDLHPAAEVVLAEDVAPTPVRQLLPHSYVWADHQEGERQVPLAARHPALSSRRGRRFRVVERVPRCPPGDAPQPHRGRRQATQLEPPGEQRCRGYTFDYASRPRGDRASPTSPFRMTT